MTDDQGYSHERALGERIARLREAAGLTQRELARRMELSQSALSRIESGQRRLSAAQVSRLARILAVEPGSLLEPDSPLETSAIASLRMSAAESAPELPQLSRGQDAQSPRRRPALRDAAAQASSAAPDRGAAHRLPAAIRLPELPPAPEPPLFAEVILDALEVEALAQAAAGSPPRPPASTRPAGATRPPGASQQPVTPRPSPFAALPHAMHADPVRLARFWRHELGVGDEGPLPDLIPLLETAGVDVVHARLDSDTPHGACALVATLQRGATAGGGGAARGGAGTAARAGAGGAAAVVDRPFVFVNGFGRPVALQRFALAHEFAHLALGHGEAYDERLDWSGRSRRETSANAFAEEFVAPLSAVRRWFEMDGEAAGSRATAREPAASPDPGAAHAAASPADPAAATVDLIVCLANHFGVSFWVARYRAKAAGIVTGPHSSGSSTMRCAPGRTR